MGIAFQGYAEPSWHGAAEEKSVSELEDLLKKSIRMYQAKQDGLLAEIGVGRTTRREKIMGAYLECIEPMAADGATRLKFVVCGDSASLRRVESALNAVVSSTYFNPKQPYERASREELFFDMVASLQAQVEGLTAEVEQVRDRCLSAQTERNEANRRAEKAERDLAQLRANVAKLVSP